MSNSQREDTTPRLQRDDRQYENRLRPSLMSEYIGQEKVKQKLSIFIKAAQKRRDPLDHTLLYGPPGLGKTTLAHIIAHEMGGSIHATSASAIDRAGALAKILTNTQLQDGDALFIDEIHRLPPAVEEVLYSAMEDYTVDIVLGKGASTRSVKIPLPRFTLVGATTRAGLLTSPLRNRFGVIAHLDYYEDEELGTIVGRSARILEIEVDEPGGQEIARRSRGTPRVANRLLRRVRDYAQIRGPGSITAIVAEQALDILEIDARGLDSMDRKILQVLVYKFGGGPVGLKTLALAVHEEAETIEEVYEPYLIREGLINRTPKGRIATQLLYEYFGEHPPQSAQHQLPLRHHPR